MNATVRWVLIIVGFLVSNAIAMGFLIVASSTSPPEVIPDYYTKAANFDDVIDQAAKNRALGWQVDVRPGLTVDVRDARGAAIDGAQVRAVITPRAHAKPFELELAALGDGRYTFARLARGLADVAVIIDRGGERFTASATIE